MNRLAFTPQPRDAYSIQLAIGCGIFTLISAVNFVNRI